VTAGGLQAAGDVADVPELPDLNGGADGELRAAVGKGQAHRGLERPVVASLHGLRAMRALFSAPFNLVARRNPDVGLLACYGGSQVTIPLVWPAYN
jgi:hypothetical protein